MSTIRSVSSRRTVSHLALCIVVTLPLSSAVKAQSYTFTNFDGPVSAAAGGTLVSTTVNGISNSGTIVGFTTDSNGGFSNFSGTASSQALLNLPVTANANGINTIGQVVGNDFATSTAFELNSVPSTAKPITLAATTTTTTSQFAFGVNDSGVIVGQFADSATGTTLGFVDAGGAYTKLQPFPVVLGTPLVVNAQGINNNDIVVGFYATKAGGIDAQGFLYDTNSMVYSIPLAPSTANTANNNLALTQFLGINDMGEAVGYYQTRDTGSQFGFLYDTATSKYTFLDDPLAAPNLQGTQVTQITGISDTGEIAGFYSGMDGVQRGFTALPVPEASTPVSLGLLLTVGLGGLVIAAKRKKASVGA